MHECKMLLIKAGNLGDAKARNDKEEARRTHQERGGGWKSVSEAEVEKEGRWRCGGYVPWWVAGRERVCGSKSRSGK